MPKGLQRSRLLDGAGYFVLAYLDDYAACEPSLHRANQSYGHFMQITKSLGLNLALKKCVKPTKTIEWLGYVIDVSAMTLAIPRLKLQEVLTECSGWATKKRASRRMIQKILGKLVHVSNGVPQGRKFVGRILDTLRQMGDREWTTVNEPFKMDIKWFLQFASISNGIRLIKPPTICHEIECDSSMDAGGGVTTGLCYTWRYGKDISSKFTSIHELEAINLVVAYKTFAPYFTTNATVCIYTDNQASSFALKTGKTRDRTLGACAREMWLAAALNQHDINIKHKPGVDIPVADALSRMHTDPLKAQFIDSILREFNLSKIDPKIDDLIFFDASI